MTKTGNFSENMGENGKKLMNFSALKWENGGKMDFEWKNELKIAVCFRYIWENQEIFAFLADFRKKIHKFGLKIVFSVSFREGKCEISIEKVGKDE